MELHRSGTFVMVNVADAGTIHAKFKAATLSALHGEDVLLRVRVNGAESRPVWVRIP